MSEWMKRLIDKHTCECFYCETQFDKKETFKLTVEMAEGQAEYDICPECAKDFDQILKGIEETRNEI